MANLINELKLPRYKHLVDILCAIAFGQLIIFILGGQALFPPNNAVFTTVVRISAGFYWLVMAGAGLVIMIRQELRFIVTVRGLPALIIGFIWLLLSGCILLYILSYSASLF